MFGFKKKTADQKTGDNTQDDQKSFATIFQNIEDGVALFDVQGTIKLFNPAAEKITGWTSKDAIGINITQVVQLVNEKGEAYSETENPLKKILASKVSMRDNNAFLMSKNKAQIAVSTSLSPIVSDSGEVTQAVIVFRDVTRERAEDQQRKDFVSTASHEMRTPIAEIEGFLSLVLNEKVATIDSRAKGFIDKAYASTKHLGKLFQDLLTTTKAEDGSITSNPQVIEMGQLIDKIAAGLKILGDQKNILTELVIGSSSLINARTGSGQVVKPLYYVFADPERINQVIDNLFDNALKYTEKGKITIGLTGNDKVVQLYIKDTGSGIPKEDLSHLFQKFYRVDSSKTRTIGGSGLGLFICKKIIELYNGRIWVESEEGQGSTFYVNLPRLSSQQVQSMTATTAVQPATKTLAK